MTYLSYFYFCILQIQLVCNLYLTTIKLKIHAISVQYSVAAALTARGIPKAIILQAPFYQDGFSNMLQLLLCNLCLIPPVQKVHSVVEHVVQFILFMISMLAIIVHYFVLIFYYFSSHTLRVTYTT